MTRKEIIEMLRRKISIMTIGVGLTLSEAKEILALIEKDGEK